MLVKIVIACWYPAVAAFWANTLLIHWSEPMNFIVALITILTSILKLAVDWSEKGDRIMFKIKRVWYWIFNKEKYREITRDDSEDFYNK